MLKIYKNILTFLKVPLAGVTMSHTKKSKKCMTLTNPQTLDDGTLHTTTWNKLYTASSNWRYLYKMSTLPAYTYTHLTVYPGDCSRSRVNVRDFRFRFARGQEFQLTHIRPLPSSSSSCLWSADDQRSQDRELIQSALVFLFGSTSPLRIRSTLLVAPSSPLAYHVSIM